MKKVYLLVLSVFMLLSLSSCRWIKESNEYVRTITEEFFGYIAVDDFENAGKLLHPESYPTNKGLKNYITTIEVVRDVDFTDGVIINRTTNFQITGYTSEFDGSTYELTYNVTISGNRYQLYVFVLKNNVGEGIYRFTVEE